MACHLFGAEPLPESVLTYCHLDTKGQLFIHETAFESHFYPAALKGSGVLSYPERAGGRAAGQTSPVNTRYAFS